MPILQIHDLWPSQLIVVDPRHVLAMLGERALSASWQVAGVTRYREALFVTGEQAADRLEALAQSQSRVSGTHLNELVHQTIQVIWGEFAAYEEGRDQPWVIIRAIDSSFCEVETDDEVVLDHVRQTFADVRLVA